MLVQGVFLLLSVEGLLVTAESIEEAFERNQIVPDVIPTAPDCLIQVVYPSGVEADKGNELTPTQVKDEPTVTYDAESSCYYTLAMVDPDVPSRENPVLGEFLHWLIGNIPGNQVAEGEALAEYLGAAPPRNTGYHRYVFLVYKQPRLLCFDEPRLTNTSEANRTLFSINNFSKKYDFGRPVAGNFFVAQYDEYVDVLNQQLSGN